MLEWEGKNRFAFFVRDDKFATVRFMSVKNLIAHDLASTFHSFLPYRVQVMKLDTRAGLGFLHRALSGISA